MFQAVLSLLVNETNQGATAILKAAKNRTEAQCAGSDLIHHEKEDAKNEVEVSKQ